MTESSNRKAVFAVTSAGVMLAVLDLFIVNVAFPAVRADFPGSSVAELSWILSAYAIVYAALLVPAGRLADLIGRKRVFMSGMGIFVAASALCSAAQSVEVLIASRILQGSAPLR